MLNGVTPCSASWTTSTAEAVDGGSCWAASAQPSFRRPGAGPWPGLALIAVAVGAAGIYVGMAIHYQLGVVDWLAAAVLTAVLAVLALCCAALMRRPGVAVPGLLGGLVITLTALSLSGFSFLDQINPDTVPWHPWVITVAAPLAVGAVGTMWTTDPGVGKRIARLAAISGCLGLYLYWNIAVAVIGGGGPFDIEGGGTLRGTIGDRLGNNLILMLVILTLAATIGWGGAAATGALADRFVNPSGATHSTTFATTAQPDPQAIPARVGAPSNRSLLMTCVIAGALILTVVAWLRG